MLIGVAVGAALELDLEQRVLPFRDMALRALEPRVPALQRVRARSVLFHRERRGLPSLHGVAGRALAAVRTLGELPVVRIGLVAIHALRESHRLLEISTRMALRAIDADVLAFQRELGLRVIEALAHRLQRNLLPSARAVAGLATLREAAVVRILVAIGTLVERDAGVLRLAIGPLV